MNKLNQLPSFINQPSQVSMNELSFSRLASPSIVATSPPPPTNPPQNGQAVTQLPVVLPKSNRAGVNLRYSLVCLYMPEEILFALTHQYEQCLLLPTLDLGPHVYTNQQGIEPLS
ncbi:hypothetical protein ACTFIZ_007922 [Dictyostelium cf. discoideum]